MGSVPEREEIHIAIVGGGIGGLALAIGLQQYGHIQVKIYESAAKFSEIGGEYSSYGINWPLRRRRMLRYFSWCFLWR
jgi:2-polyprenyl-6-methoxyphenol hydroxylase-like FAD-dependent oxidoreductase